MDTIPNVGNDLVRIHKVITRALNVSLQNSQDTNLAETYRPGFVSYVRALTILLHGHHLGEDELTFPFWKIRLPTGPFDELSTQHRKIITHLERIIHWLDLGHGAWQANVLGELHHALSDMQLDWETHIALEEVTISPENSQKYLTPSENQELTRQIAEHGQAHAQPSEMVMPFIIYNLPGTDRAEYVKLLPPVMLQQLIPGPWKAVWEPMTPFLLTE